MKEKDRIIAAYRGPRAYKPGILEEYGWSGEDSERVFEVERKVMIKGWMEERRLEMSGMDDVEMI